MSKIDKPKGPLSSRDENINPRRLPTPGSQNQAPGSQNQAPGSQNQAPGNQNQAPGNQNQAPGNQNQAPVFGGEKKNLGRLLTSLRRFLRSSNQNQAPGNQNQAPGNENQAPSNQNQASGNQNQAPGNTNIPPQPPSLPKGYEKEVFEEIVSRLGLNLDEFKRHEAWINELIQYVQEMKSARTSEEGERVFSKVMDMMGRIQKGEYNIRASDIDEFLVKKLGLFLVWDLFEEVAKRVTKSNRIADINNKISKRDLIGAICTAFEYLYEEVGKPPGATEKDYRGTINSIKLALRGLLPSLEVDGNPFSYFIILGLNKFLEMFGSKLRFKGPVSPRYVDPLSLDPKESKWFLRFVKYYESIYLQSCWGNQNQIVPPVQGGNSNSVHGQP